MTQRVMVTVWEDRDRTQARVNGLTYEAPDDAAVGDTGLVNLWVAYLGQTRTFNATIIAIGSDYDGPCRPFWPRPEKT